MPKYRPGIDYMQLTEVEHLACPLRGQTLEKSFIIFISFHEMAEIYFWFPAVLTGSDKRQSSPETKVSRPLSPGCFAA